VIPIHLKRTVTFSDDDVTFFDNLLDLGHFVWEEAVKIDAFPVSIGHVVDKNAAA
jgi:hypothetical protein